MLAIFALSLLIFTQTTLASSSDDDWLDLRDLSHPLDAGKKKTRSNPNYEEKCDQDPIDLGLIIDSSVSIGSTNFTLGLEFLAGFLNEFDIGQDQVRVAAVSFGLGVYTRDGFNFTSYNNKDQVKNKVMNMPYRQGTRTDTGDALKHMREVQMAMRRPSVEQIVVVLTDGNSQRTVHTKEQATETKKSNITVFALGVGKVQYNELLNIAGGVKENVLQVASYDDLDEDIKKNLTRKTCSFVPVSEMAAVPSTAATPTCKLEIPVDVIFVFSAATMGVEQISNVISFIGYVIEHDELNEGFQFGVVSGDCPNDEGFRLNQYQNFEAIREHVKRYNQNNLPHIIQRTIEAWFTTEYGARVNAIKTAVIFLGNNRVNGKELGRTIKRMLAADIRVFVSASDCKILSALALCLPSEVTLLNGNTFSQATQLVNHLCPKKFEERNLPDCEYNYEGCVRL